MSWHTLLPPPRNQVSMFMFVYFCFVFAFGLPCFFHCCSRFSVSPSFLFRVFPILSRVWAHNPDSQHPKRVWSLTKSDAPSRKKNPLLPANWSRSATLTIHCCEKGVVQHSLDVTGHSLYISLIWLETMRIHTNAESHQVICDEIGRRCQTLLPPLQGREGRLRKGCFRRGGGRGASKGGRGEKGASKGLRSHPS